MWCVPPTLEKVLMKFRNSIKKRGTNKRFYSNKQTDEGSIKILHRNGRSMISLAVFDDVYHGNDCEWCEPSHYAAYPGFELFGFHPDHIEHYSHDYNGKNHNLHIETYNIKW